MVDSIFSLLEHNVMRYTAEGVVPERVGNRHPISAPFDVYESKDGYVVIATANDSLFHRLCKLMEQESLMEDERFITEDRKSTRLNSSHVSISYAVLCLKKKKEQIKMR